MALVPAQALIEDFAEWAIRDAGPLARDLSVLAERGYDATEFALLIEGIKCLEGRAGEAYERRVRQAAAVCLRTGVGGGLLMLCAACVENV